MAARAGNLVGKGFLSCLSAVVFEFSVIVGIELIEGGESVLALTLLLRKELSFLGGQFHTTPS